VISGGLACVAGVGLILVAFPALLRFDADGGAIGELEPAAA
jgi:hypothetical protein